MKKVLLIGEPMALFVAETTGPLEDIAHFTRMLAGAEINVGIGLKRLGLNPAYMTKLGQDPLGQYIFKRIRAEGIDTSAITFDERYSTGLMLKGKVEKGDPPIAYFRKNSAASHICVADVLKINFQGIGLLHVTGITPALSEDCLDACIQLMKEARSQGIFITFDPNLRPTLWKDCETMITQINRLAFMADMVLPGIGEAKILTGASKIEKVADFYHQKGVSKVVVKEGPKGAGFSDGGNITWVSGFAVEKVVDTVGAGDGFAAGVISGVLEGLGWEDCIRRGNAIGAIQVMHKGDNEGLPTRKELETFMAAHHS